MMTFEQLWGVKKSFNINFDRAQRCHFFSTNVKTLFLYGFETWRITITVVVDVVGAVEAVVTVGALTAVA